jgi:hypothetical protein
MGFSRKALVLAALAVTSAGIGALVACSSSGNAPGNGQGSGEGGTSPQSACTQNNALELVFSPMYSAYVTDSTQQVFQIPVVANGLGPGATATWSASDPTAVTIADDSADTPGAQMITINKVPQGGTVTITANAGGLCGSSTLNITSATEAQWAAGNARYNSDVQLDNRCINGAPTTRDGGPCPDAGPACTQCHGASANAAVGFNDVAHTPEQTGGFSDQDLINIVVNGVVPDGGYFDPSIISYQGWQGFHHWGDIQGADQQGMVVYLRSLTPSAQDGTSNFGGHYDGGHGDGGHRHDGGHEGGFGPPPDAGAGDGPATD